MDLPGVRRRAPPAARSPHRPTARREAARLPAPAAVDPNHLGVEVATTDQVSAATKRFTAAKLATFEENDTACCYALQDKVWVHGPGQEPWEIYVVKSDAHTLGKSATGAPEIDACCGTTACSTPGEHPIET